ncbi:HlyD family secretion protein [Chitinimonas sp.]|uniref:HlyD family secretion protein n=1 Tax=Chitinimonas sp. TaxID=1934313 RepID=UPI0035B4F728
MSVTDQAASSPASAAATAPRSKSWRFVLVIGALLLVALLLIASAWGMTPFSGRVEVTDNAYVRGRTVVVAPQVSGYVQAVEVADYAQVKAGQVLVRIDDGIYRARLEQAKAAVSAQTAALANSRQAHASRQAATQVQKAAHTSAAAQLDKARADLARIEGLVSDGSVSQRERDQAVAAVRVAEAQLRQTEATMEIARQDVTSVEVGQHGLEAQLASAKAQLRLAEIDLEHTVIRAPEDGQLGEVNVRRGQYVTNGTQLLAMVPPDRWVIANFKEAQTAHMQPGQAASLSVDALAGAQLRGTIERVSPAAGSEFAVLKPDNATGNFVKVPQRIGVRIALNPNQPLVARLRPGMSLEARVETGGRP